MVTEIICPACKLGDQIEKVSSIYIHSLELRRKNPKSSNDSRENISAPVSSQLSNHQIKLLSQKLKPPSTPRQAFTRPVHPDVVVITFSMIIPFFLYGIFSSQKSFLTPSLVILASLYALYIWKRGQIIAKFQRDLDERTGAEMKAKRGIERWMKMYYCARDDGVFDLTRNELIPVDFLPGYLFEESGNLPGSPPTSK